MKFKPDEPEYRKKSGSRVEEASGAASSHILAFARSSVGVVTIRGAREQWIAPALLHNCSIGIEESMWTTTPETVIGLRLYGATVEDHNQKKIRTSGPGRELTLQPKGARTRYLAKGGIEFGQVFLPDALLDRASEVEGIAPLSGRVRDDLSFAAEKTLQTLTCDYLRRAFDTHIPATSLEMEGRALLLVDWLARLHQPPRAVGALPTGGLSPGHLSRVCEFIVENLAKDLFLDDLANLTGLSSKHFARAFKQSTGLPPHQYVVMQRIEAAKRLLVGKSSLTDIALACGFADHSHFTATFRRIVGVAPGTWRDRYLS